MSNPGQAIATEVSRVPQASRAWAWQVGVLLVLVAFLYRGVLTYLVRDWWNDDNFSHGFFVPVFALYVVWQERLRLLQLPLRPSWWGAGVIAASLATLVAGVLGAELFLSRASLVVLLAGLIIHFLGWRWFRELLFPWASLFLMIPIPAIIFNQITFPLQLLASELAHAMLALFSVPVLREGNILRLPVMTLEVAEACSGIRSLVSLFTLAVIYGYFLENKTWRRVLMVVAAVPIAVVANASRVMGTGLVAEYWEPSKAEGFFHEFSGWVIFVVSLGLLLLVHRLLRLWPRQQAAEAAS